MGRWMAVWAMAWAALSFSGGRMALASQASASDPEAHLRARVEGYGQAMRRGDWAKVGEFVNPGQRAAFRRVKKTTALSYTIDKIVLEENRQRAQVFMTVKKPVFDRPPIEVSVQNTWELIDGEWFILFKRAGRERARGLPIEKKH